MSDETIDTADHDMSAPELTVTALTRRGFLAATGAAGAAVAAATALGGATPAGASATRPVKGGGGNKDLETAAFAASLEVLAVGTYTAALDAATAGSLGPVPPAGAEFVTTAMSQHQAQLDSWNEVLTTNGQAEVTEPDPALKATVDEAFGQVTDFVGAAELALMLEQIAAATYLQAIPRLKAPDAIELAGSIYIIDMQHAAILNFVLGEYPVPETFASTDDAAQPS
ncbi:MAG: ferritin-like domain-containing protein [Actinobacteria bacterium]|nr:ferritin-like domain-containing protein [Actinomycetota bacterium]